MWTDGHTDRQRDRHDEANSRFPNARENQGGSAGWVMCKVRMIISCQKDNE